MTEIPLHAKIFLSIFWSALVVYFVWSYRHRG